jgi:hypothetical protein
MSQQEIYFQIEREIKTAEIKISQIRSIATKDPNYEILMGMYQSTINNQSEILATLPVPSTSNILLKNLQIPTMPFINPQKITRAPQ